MAAVTISLPNRFPPAALLVLAFFVSPASVRAADLAAAEKLFRTGQYDECAQTAARETAGGSADEQWWSLKVRSEVARGKYTEATDTLGKLVQAFPDSPALLLLAYETYRDCGRKEEAESVAVRFKQLAQRRIGFHSPEAKVAYGRYLLLRGADAKEVLERYFTDSAKPADRHPEFAFAAAELALSKHDYGLAAETLLKASKTAAEDPRYHYLLARAFAPDDRARCEKAVADALAINPRHADSLLMRADKLIDDEDYAGAEAVLKKVLDVDPMSPRAWAYRAVIAHLRSNAAGETDARKTALSRWATNPAVDHLIGRKLSRAYRFAEGAACQWKALAFDPGYLPAKGQLCQDLLRLGDEEAGWKLAAELSEKDGYDVVAYNLVGLHDSLAKFRTIVGDGIILRMDPKEADLYGPRAMAVLKKARTTLGEKYGVRLDRPVVVEVFPRKEDFAVRTFGLPQSEGILGVCFGPVVTALSPAARGQGTFNWESVLWHEFCHTVTLHKTRNKMPRWLSEGISVYEEMRENPGWGQWLEPHYREMILGDDLTPLSKLSSAFLNPKSAGHLAFAYLESAMAVEFLVGRFGLDSLKAALDDLGTGLTVNDALVRRTGASLDKLDSEFVAFARGRANATAAGATWERPDLPDDADSAALAAWLK
jgi:tetratricopeptide (TPR) repeat protein